MSTTNPSEQERSDTTTAAQYQDAVGPDRGDVPTNHLDLPTDTKLLGVDGHGHTHLHSTRRDWVVVITPDGDVTHEQVLGGCSVCDWVKHTEQCRGDWDALQYRRGGWAENLFRTITEADQDADTKTTR